MPAHLPPLAAGTGTTAAACARATATTSPAAPKPTPPLQQTPPPPAPPMSSTTLISGVQTSCPSQVRLLAVQHRGGQAAHWDMQGCSNPSQCSPSPIGRPALPSIRSLTCLPAAKWADTAVSAASPEDCCEACSLYDFCQVLQGRAQCVLHFVLAARPLTCHTSVELAPPLLPLCAGMDLYRRLKLPGALPQCPRVLLPKGAALVDAVAVAVLGAGAGAAAGASCGDGQLSKPVSETASSCASLLNPPQKGSGYEVRSAPGMISGTTNTPPPAQCSLEFDTDLTGGDLLTADGAPDPASKCSSTRRAGRPGVAVDCHHLPSWR